MRASEIMKILVALAFLPFCALAQNSCFTDCYSNQTNNPSSGSTCYTRCNNEANSKPQGVMESFASGANAMAKVQDDQARREMINRARQDCLNGNSNGCDYLKRNNIY